MNDITPYLFDKQSEIRSIVRNGEPWFVAKDVSDVLELSNSRMALAALDDDEKADVSLTYTSSNNVTQERLYTVINEFGLYTLILRSRKAMTPGTVQHRFRKWVTSEVLPSIRKTGHYGGALPDPDDIGTPIKGPEFIGFRFAEERLRLGFETKRDLANATGIKINQITNCEEVGKDIKNQTTLTILMDHGFDVRYLQTGIRSPFRPVGPDEAALIRAYRQLPEEQKPQAIANFQRLSLPSKRYDLT